VKDNQDTPANLERRRFFSTSAKYGFTAAVVAGASGSLKNANVKRQPNTR